MLCDNWEVNHILQDIVLEFMWDVFSFEKARYTTVEELAEDILRLAKERAVVAKERLSVTTPHRWKLSCLPNFKFFDHRDNLFTSTAW